MGGDSVDDVDLFVRVIDSFMKKVYEDGSIDKKKIYSILRAEYIDMHFSDIKIRRYLMKCRRK